MTLRIKLLLALLPFALVLVALGWLSAGTVTTLGDAAQLILEANYRSVLVAQNMKETLERIDSAALFLVAGRRERGLDQARVNEGRFESELRLQEGNITEPGEAEATAELRAAWNDYRQAFARFAQSPRAEDYFATLFPLFERTKAAANRVLFINQDAMVLKSDRARATARRSLGIIVAGTLGAFLVGLLASGVLTARLLRPLKVLGQAVRRIGEGDLKARASVATGDEIGALAHEFNTMAERLGEYQRSSLGELLQAQQAAQAAIDSLPDPVVVIGAGGEVLNVNAAAETLLRPTPGADALAHAPAELRPVLERVRLHVLGGKGAYSPKGFEEAVPFEGRQFLPRATPLYSDQGGVQGATIVLQDVSRLMRFDELKNDLVATVAHEFRTPLTSLRMAIHLCLEEAAGPITEKQQELLSAAREECERLQTIVDDLLDLSRIRSGRVSVSLVPIPAKTLVDAVVGDHREAAAAAGVSLAGTIVEPVLPVHADAERIALVLGNLVQNALRYAPQGSLVEVRAEPVGKEVRFSVTDRGPGIAPEFHERVFEKFFRLPGSRGEGIGLGLYIAREVVAAHGGTMGVFDNAGGGSTFWFTLPVHAPGARTG